MQAVAQPRVPRAFARLLTLLTVLTLSMPTFWMIDVMQAAQNANSPQTSHSSQQTLRFDESRSEQETLEVVSDDKPEGSPGLDAQGSDTEGLVHAALTHPTAAVVRESFIPAPALSGLERQRISRLLLPLSPVKEVPTSPPLVAA
ncbi:hypothetical protein QBL02_00130 [Leucobacter sp. UT-8R-CII-1-4]|uniref:hypothetical protein n=1 Tax=Leucobacter sp. UT-8R-CII-1-4 TaxID=3040075 RepID=UPI0024A9458A|nr:hypothetical protein [Leucobacter sp. UT-8R-CII-1-4]MDI6021945.1 hypothetical protein [Leucobacter sp. UT-8R-CII-1-4]